MSTWWTFRAGASVLALSLASPGWAQEAPGAAPDASNPNASPRVEQLQDIVVTAQRRAENLQKVPLSVVAIGGPALEARGITDVTALGVSVPGLQISVNKGMMLPFLRGVGASGTSLSVESKVAVYADGVYFARLPSTFFDLKNVERVEVLKGPQGTLFGRNSTGGVINIVTRDPSFNTKISGGFGYGNYQQIDGHFYATTGLTDTLAIDLSLSGHTNDGYGRNITTGNRYEYEDAVLARSKLLFEPTDTTRFVLSGFYSWSLISGTKSGFPGTTFGTLTLPRVVYRVEDFGYHNAIDDNDNHDSYHIWGTQLRVEHELPFAKLTSISAYTHHNETSLFEGDRTPRPDFYLRFHGHIRQFTQELQISNLKDSPFAWIGGLYYYNNRTRYVDAHFISPILYGPGLETPAHQNVKSYAAYAQATVEILPRLKLTGGIRYTADKTSAQGVAFLKTNPPTFILHLPESTSDVNRATFKVALDYQLTDRILTYALFSRGFKSGNYNIFTYNSTTPTKAEGLDDYEVGFKSDLFDRRVRLNGSLFYYRITNPQVQLLLNNTVFFSNAGKARVKGAEFDGEVIVARGLTGRFSATFLDSKYTDYPNAPTSAPDPVNGGSNPAPNIDASGLRTPLAAKTTFNIGGDYTIDTSAGEVTLTADFYHNSGYFYEPDNYLHQGAFDLVNAQIKYKPSDNLAIRLWGKNLLDTQYTANGATLVGRGGYIWGAAPPLTYGLAIDFDF